MTPTAARPPERSSLLAAMVTAGLMIVQQIGAKTTRDTFFLSNHPASLLPEVMIGAALLSLVTAFAFSRILKRFGPVRAMPLAYALHAALFVGEWWFAGRAPALVSVVLYLHMGALGPLVISGFWSLVNERFDPHTAKRFVSRIAASAAFGGVLGGVLAQRMTAVFELTTMLPALALVTCMAGVVLTRIGGSLGAPSSRELGTSSMKGLGATNYLRDLAAIVLITSATAGLLDYVLKAEAAATFQSPAELASFFALFHAALSALVFVVQSSFSARALGRLGIGGTIALLPAAVVLGGVLSASLTRLWTVALVNGLENILRNSLFRSGYELLYTPVDKARKRAAKALIDVGFDRLGDIIAAGLVLVVMALLPRDTNQVAVGLSLVTAALGLVLALRLHRGYVSELAASLRAGAVRIGDTDSLDATTRRTLTDTTLAIDREQLLAEIRALQARQAQHAGGPVSASPEREERLLEQQRLLARIRVLVLGDDLELRQLLESELSDENFDARLIPFLIPLLGRREFARAAVTTLQEHAHGSEGALVDALLDPTQSATIRRRIPRVLRSFPTPRSSAGLFAGLNDASFEVRYQCALGLLKLCKSNPELAPDRERVFQLVTRESDVPREEWTRSISVTDSDGLTLSPPPAPGHAPPRVEYVFTLLSTVLEAEPLALCLKAVASGDPSLRGTALEYLENVLPARVYAPLSQHLLSGIELTREKRERPPAQIVQELSLSMSNLRLDPEELRKANN